jgi:hypothetical protein
VLFLIEVKAKENLRAESLRLPFLPSLRKRVGERL